MRLILPLLFIVLLYIIIRKNNNDLPVMKLYHCFTYVRNIDKLLPITSRMKLYIPDKFIQFFKHKLKYVNIGIIFTETYVDKNNNLKPYLIGYKTDDEIKTFSLWEYKSIDGMMKAFIDSLMEIDINNFIFVTYYQSKNTYMNNNNNNNNKKCYVNSSLYDISLDNIMPYRYILYLYSMGIFPHAVIYNIKTYQDVNKFNKLSGIYLWLNKINGKIYIGSAVNLNKRLLHYFLYKSLIAKNTMIINKSILKYGINHFSLFILEINKDVLKTEQKYFDILNPDYNILNFAHNSSGYKDNYKSINLMRNLPKTKINSIHSFDIDNEFIPHFFLGFFLFIFISICNFYPWYKPWSC